MSEKYSLKVFLCLTRGLVLKKMLNVCLSEAVVCTEVQVCMIYLISNAY